MCAKFTSALIGRIFDREDFTLVLRLLARVGRDAALQGQQRILRFAKDDNFLGDGNFLRARRFWTGLDCSREGYCEEGGGVLPGLVGGEAG
jgi:hypothetical protein